MSDIQILCRNIIMMQHKAFAFHAVFTLKVIGLELHKTMDCHVSWNIKKRPNIRATILDNGIIMLNVSRCHYSCNFSCVT